jgi:hypothetical protein
MKPATLDLPTIWRGCDWGPVTLKWKDANGQPINLAGWQCRAQSLNIFLGAVITDRAHGVTTLSLSKGETALFKLGTEKWDWIWERTNGSYRFPPFLSGKVQIKDPVTATGTDPGSPGIPELPDEGDPPELIEPPPTLPV